MVLPLMSGLKPLDKNKPDFNHVVIQSAYRSQLAYPVCTFLWNNLCSVFPGASSPKRPARGSNPARGDHRPASRVSGLRRARSVGTRVMRACRREGRFKKRWLPIYACSKKLKCNSCRSSGGTHHIMCCLWSHFKCVVKDKFVKLLICE